MISCAKQRLLISQGNQLAHEHHDSHTVPSQEVALHCPYWQGSWVVSVHVPKAQHSSSDVLHLKSVHFSTALCNYVAFRRYAVYFVGGRSSETF
jgi:hypothetical protein